MEVVVADVMRSEKPLMKQKLIAGYRVMFHTSVLQSLTLDFGLFTYDARYVNEHMVPSL